MSEKDTLIKIKKKPKKLEDIVTTAIEQIQVIDVYDPESDTLVQTTAEALRKSFYQPPDKTAVNVVYKVVYPDDLNLKPVPGSQKSRSRAGRPKKSKVSTQAPMESQLPSQKSKIKVVSKTRSGREVKFPKYIQSDFKKIEIDDDNSPADPNDCDIKISDFVRYTEKDKQKDVPKLNEEKPPELDSVQKKRRIAAQYRCPKCKKAYLGRSKILEHLKKNPSHGPMHQNEGNHFEVWNYLVSITQKCPSSERGPKFCQELSNLLHNLMLLTNALFKKLGSAANEVKIDKVLGNAIGLGPGTYYFDDNNLYKDVTVLQLMGNTEFLNSIRSKTDDNLFRSPDSSEKNCNCGKLSTIDELVLKSMLISSEANDSIAKKIHNIKIDQQNPSVQDKCEIDNSSSELDGNKQFIGDNFFVSTDANLSNYSPLNDFEMKSELENRLRSHDLTVKGHFTDQNVLSDTKNFVPIHDKKEALQPHNVNFKANIDISGNDYFPPNVSYEPNNFSVNYDGNQGVLNHINIGSVHDKSQHKSPKIKIQSNILICPPNPKFIQASCTKPYNETQILQTKNPINPELLSDNSISLPIANLQHTVDELMLPVSSESGSILDNSSSSDEVMNVDQFVNERFRRITESDLEATNSNSLNLDLPALDLFQFHTT